MTTVAAFLCRHVASLHLDHPSLPLGEPFQEKDSLKVGWGRTVHAWISSVSLTQGQSRVEEQACLEFAHSFSSP